MDLSLENYLKVLKCKEEIGELVSIVPLNKDEIYFISAGDSNWAPSKEWFIELYKCLKEMSIEAIVVPKAYIVDINIIPKNNLKQYLIDYRNIIDKKINELE